MFIKQLSIFVENKAGRLQDMLTILKDNDINLASLSLADTSDYGVLRLLVSDPEKGKEVLRAAGVSCRTTEVLAIKMSHKVGQLQEVLGIICKVADFVSNNGKATSGFSGSGSFDGRIQG